MNTKVTDCLLCIWYCYKVYKTPDEFIEYEVLIIKTTKLYLYDILLVGMPLFVHLCALLLKILQI